MECFPYSHDLIETRMGKHNRIENSSVKEGGIDMQQDGLGNGFDRFVSEKVE